MSRTVVVVVQAASNVNERFPVMPILNKGHECEQGSISKPHTYIVLTEVYCFCRRKRVGVRTVPMHDQDGGHLRVRMGTRSNISIW